jgi:hypothetical protein
MDNQQDQTKSRFELKNLFNAKAITIGLLATAGVLGLTFGVAIVDAFAYMHSTSPNTPFLLAGGVIASGLTGLWNAHAVGGQTTVGQSKGLTVARNLALMTATSVAPAIALGILASPAAPILGTIIGLVAGASLNAKWLKWEPNSTPAKEKPEQEPFQHKESHFAKAMKIKPLK